MPLFDNDRERTDLGPAKFSEDLYEYYDRSARPGVVAIRQTLDGWFDDYPADKRPELKRRFETDFEAGFFELFVHRLAEVQGHSIVVDPELPSGTPDFGVVVGDRVEAVIEVTVSRGETDEEAAKRRIEEVLLDRINELETMGFYLDVDIERTGRQQPSGTRLLRELDEWLDGLDPDEVVTTYKDRGYLGLPEWRFEDRGTVVRFRPWPMPQPGDIIDRPIAMHGAGGARRLAEDEPIRSSLESKGRKYRQVDVPYTVVVNARGEFPCEPRDIANAVFGPEMPVETLHDGNRIVWTRERRGGLWTLGGRPSKTHVSAVVVFIYCHPWKMGNTPVFVVRNPHAERADYGVFDAFPEMTIAEDGVTVDISEGSTTGEILGIQPGWPLSLEEG